MRTHENLEVWKRSIEFALSVYETTAKFPNDEKYGLTSQLRRASVSIPSNIAEGAARNSTKEFIYFLSNAQGSASEVATQLLIAFRLGYFHHDKYKKLMAGVDEIGRMLSGLKSHLLKKKD